MNVGRGTSFEVTANGQLVYSKLKENAFPDFDDVVRVIGEYQKSGAVSTAKKGAESGGSSCVVM